MYALFMKERTQKEAIELLYNKEYSKINISPFKKAREKLMEDGYIESDGSLRNAKFKAQPEPFIEETEKKYKEDYGENLSKEYKQGLKLILRSEWFRSVFSSENFSKFKNIERNDEEKLQLTSSPLTFVGEIFTDMVAFTCIYKASNDIEVPTIEDVASYNSFSEYIEDYGGWFLESFELKEGKEPLSKEEVFEMVAEDHLITEERKPWHYEMLNYLIYETGMFLKLPRHTAEATPGRRNSNLYSHSCDLYNEFKDRYRFNVKENLSPFEKEEKQNYFKKKSTQS